MRICAVASLVCLGSLVAVDAAVTPVEDEWLEIETDQHPSGVRGVVGQPKYDQSHDEQREPSLREVWSFFNRTIASHHEKIPVLARRTAQEQVHGDDAALQLPISSRFCSSPAPLFCAR